MLIFLPIIQLVFLYIQVFQHLHQCKIFLMSFFLNFNKLNIYAAYSVHVPWIINSKWLIIRIFKF
jgi:hypothetical protein